LCGSETVFISRLRGRWRLAHPPGPTVLGNSAAYMVLVVPALPAVVNAGLNPKPAGLGGVAAGRFYLKIIWSGLVEAHKAKTQDLWWEGLQD
jgi:hypothetical protein